MNDLKNFMELGICPEFSTILKNNGISRPTPIQEKTIPVALAGKDVIGQAQTGTGKTLAFVLPVLERIDPKKEQVQALIITPTRELALQITNEIKLMIKGREEIKVLAVYGGQDLDRQMRKLQGSRQIVVATPGRLLDHLRRGTISLGKVSMLVLDEADEILRRGFLDELVEILRVVPTGRQTMLFSATMPDQVKELATHYMRDPEDIRVRGTQVTLEGIKQSAVEVTEANKLAMLFHLIDEYRPYLALVFCGTRQRAMVVNAALQQNGYDADEIHGDLSQNKREQVIKRFRQAKIQILVATDLAARGLDVEGITHVFNYDFPRDAENYIHRIGRTGRAGEEGMAVTLVERGEMELLSRLEQAIKGTIHMANPETPLPNKKIDFTIKRSDLEKRHLQHNRDKRSARENSRGKGRTGQRTGKKRSKS